MPQADLARRLSAMAAAGGSSIAVGSSVAASTVILAYPWFAGQALRYALGAVLLVLLLHRRLPRLRLAQVPRLLGLAAVGMAGFNIFLMAALQQADAGTVGAIVGGVPVALALLGPLLRGERPVLRAVVAAVIVSGGAALVKYAGPADTTPAGIALAVAALLCEVGFSALALSLLRELGPAGVATYGSAASALMLGAASLAVEGPAALRPPTTAEGAALAYLAVVVTAAAFLLWYTALTVLPVETAGLFAGLVPVAALGASALVGAIGMTLPRILGILVVAGGVVLGATRSRRPPRSARVRSATAAHHHDT
ncbi:DMT family transporter [Nocardiopsis mangrovi]|uniref:DMT family transporter n=1 Tax=Nocardiopsis mangrovi TaxID=1179818 RepID=A0ABV9DWW6_9ACTN